MTAKKKHLIELMIEAGVKWPDSAEYAAQDKDSWLAFYTRKPYMEPGKVTWSSDSGYVGNSLCKLHVPCRNWHQTIVTREQYENALADVGRSQAGEMPSDEPAASAMPSIEQLTADYHAKAEKAQRLQKVADDALKLANDALISLQNAGEVIGLVISVNTLQKCTEQHQQPIITDWHDLRVGDVIECTAYNDERDDPWPGGWATKNIGTQQVVYKINDSTGKISIKDSKDSGYAFKFIRRP